MRDPEVLTGYASLYRQQGVGVTLQEAKKWFSDLGELQGKDNYGPFVIASFGANSIDELITTGLELQSANYTRPVDKDPEYFI